MHDTYLEFVHPLNWNLGQCQVQMIYILQWALRCSFIYLQHPLGDTKNFTPHNYGLHYLMFWKYSFLRGLLLLCLIFLLCCSNLQLIQCIFDLCQSLHYFLPLFLNIVPGFHRAILHIFSD
jgi:hypothetical protein